MSQVSESYFIKALHDAKVEELRKSYANRGYLPEKKTSPDGNSFDLVLRNQANGRLLAFEVKMLPISREASDQINKLKDRAIQLGYDFRLVTIVRPRKYDIEIEWLDQALLEYIIEQPPREIEGLATHTAYENVDVLVTSLSIAEDQARAQVQGTIDVEFQYGSSGDLASDMGMVSGDSFPFEGEIELDMSSHSVTTANIKVDVSEWDNEEEDD